MKISQLIRKLEQIKKEHGDLEVKRSVINYEVEKLYKMNSDDFRFLFRIEDEVRRYDENLPTDKYLQVFTPY